MTKPFYRRKSFVSLVVGVLILIIGFIAIVSAFLAHQDISAVSLGFAIGLGVGFLYAWAGMWNLEQEFQGKGIRA